MKRLIVLLFLSACLIHATLGADFRPTAQELITHFKMEHIPDEGPWFALTYRSEDIFTAGSLPERYKGERVAGNAIIALATQIDFSAMHRLKTDEVWHYYLGNPLQMLILHPDGSGEVVALGPDVLNGQQLQHVVPRGAWQGAIPLVDANSKGQETYTVFGDTLAPGFEYSDFEMGYRDELQKDYPQYAELIGRLTRKEFMTRPRSTSNSGGK